jgi:hypothetical protein
VHCYISYRLRIRNDNAPSHTTLVVQQIPSSPNRRTLRISLQVTFGCFLPSKWASRRHVSQPWRTSTRMRLPNSGRFLKKPSADASNNDRINGASVYVSKRPTLKALCKRCRMSYHYSAIPPFRELFGYPSYILHI